MESCNIRIDVLAQLKRLSVEKCTKVKENGPM